MSKKRPRPPPSVDTGLADGQASSDRTLRNVFFAVIDSHRRHHREPHSPADAVAAIATSNHVVNGSATASSPAPATSTATASMSVAHELPIALTMLGLRWSRSLAARIAAAGVEGLFMAPIMKPSPTNSEPALSPKHRAGNAASARQAPASATEAPPPPPPSTTILTASLSTSAVASVSPSVDARLVDMQVSANPCAKPSAPPRHNRAVTTHLPPLPPPSHSLSDQFRRLLQTGTSSAMVRRALGLFKPAQCCSLALACQRVAPHSWCARRGGRPY